MYVNVLSIFVSVYVNICTAPNYVTEYVPTIRYCVPTIRTIYVETAIDSGSILEKCIRALCPGQHWLTLFIDLVNTHIS